MPPRLLRISLGCAIAFPLAYFAAQILAAPFFPGFDIRRVSASDLGGPEATQPWIFNTCALLFEKTALAASFPSFSPSLCSPRPAAPSGLLTIRCPTRCTAIPGLGPAFFSCRCSFPSLLASVPFQNGWAAPPWSTRSFSSSSSRCSARSATAFSQAFARWSSVWPPLSPSCRPRCWRARFDDKTPGRRATLDYLRGPN
jgi:hypothetical protein